MTRTFLFDLDNTLVRNQEKYEEAKHALADRLLHELDPDAYDDPRTIVDEVIDAEDGQRYGAVGVTDTRFRDSMVNAVYDIAKREEVDGRNAPIDAIVQYAEFQGMKPMLDYGEDDLLPGAVEALDYVQDQGDNVILLTKGVEDWQEWKLSATGLDEYPYRIVDGKTQDVFDELVGDTDPERVWKVGDSPSSDVVPALRYGIGAIYVTEEVGDAAWTGEEADEELAQNDRWFPVSDLQEFPIVHETIQEYETSGDIAVLQDARQVTVR